MTQDEVIASVLKECKELRAENERLRARLSLADALRDAVQAGGGWDDVAREVERLIEAKLDDQRKG